MQMIKTEKVGDRKNVGLIRLDRPKALNALCKELMQEVGALICSLKAFKYLIVLEVRPPHNLWFAEERAEDTCSWVEGCLSSVGCTPASLCSFQKHSLVSMKTVLWGQLLLLVLRGHSQVTHCFFKLSARSFIYTAGDLLSGRKSDLLHSPWLYMSLPLPWNWSLLRVASIISGLVSPFSSADPSAHRWEKLFRHKKWSIIRLAPVAADFPLKKALGRFPADSLSEAQA